MIDSDTRSAAAFFREIRRFADSAKPWDSSAVFYDTKPDEVYDLSLVSKRIYGRRDEFFAVMAAAGLDTIDQPLTQRRIVLPKEGTLYSIKRRTGFESVAAYREGFAPVWSHGDDLS